MHREVLQGRIARRSDFDGDRVLRSIGFPEGGLVGAEFGFPGGVVERCGPLLARLPLDSCRGKLGIGRLQDGNVGQHGLIAHVRHSRHLEFRVYLKLADLRLVEGQSALSCLIDLQRGEHRRRQQLRLSRRVPQREPHAIRDRSWHHQPHLRQRLERHFVTKTLLHRHISSFQRQLTQRLGVDRLLLHFGLRGKCR